MESKDLNPIFPILLLRVYVKKPEHLDVIREAYLQRLADVPVVFTYADVCRDDLLVEIEGIVSCRKS